MMMLVLALALAIQSPSVPPMDVTRIVVGPTVAVAELDLGKLKGDLRQIGWSANGLQIYVQTVEGHPPSEKVHHYAVSALDGAIQTLDVQPDWARQYWAFKSDRYAPGDPSIEIEVKREQTNEKVGTGSARPGTAAVSNADNYENGAMAAEGQKLPVVKFLLFGETVSEFKNEPPVPGAMFGWGPPGTASIAFTDRDGRLMLLDRARHTQKVRGAKDASFPAWSADGAHLAWVQKSGRRKYTLMAAPVGE